VSRSLPPRGPGPGDQERPPTETHPQGPAESVAVLDHAEGLAILDGAEGSSPQR